MKDDKKEQKIRKRKGIAGVKVLKIIAESLTKVQNENREVPCAWQVFVGNWNVAPHVLIHLVSN